MAHVLRIARSDAGSPNHVLVKVEPRTTTGSLDLKLIGTEGEHPYVASSEPPGDLLAAHL